MNMSQKKKNRVFFFYESPWPFLVSTACLFLTLGAVLFLDSFYFLDAEVQLLMINFSSLKKLKTKATYLTTLVISNYIARNYSFQSWGYGKAGWNPDNYGSVAKTVLIDLKEALVLQDKVAVYNIMYAIINDDLGVFTKSYGKVFRNADSIISQYNSFNPTNMITEKEYLQQHKYTFEESELFFLDRTNRGTIVTNIQEILAPKLLMQKHKNILVERACDLQDKVNLSGQSNPEYSVGMFIADDQSKINLVIYDSDLKTTDEQSLYAKLLDLASQKKLNIVQISGKQTFGFNIFVVAVEDLNQKNVILTQEQTNLIASIILDKAKQHPEHFKTFRPQSENFKSFLSTGNTKYLNELDVPTPRFYLPKDFCEIPHDKQVFLNSKVYKSIVDEAYKLRGNPNNINVTIESNDIID